MRMLKDWKRVMAAAVLFLAISQAVHTLVASVSMGFYLDPAYFAVWSRIMMPGEGPPPASFFLLSAASGFVSALIYVAIFRMLRASIPGKKALNKGLNFGFWVVFLLGSVPGYLNMYLLINLPAALMVVWGAESLTISLLGGAVIGRLNAG